MHMLGMDAILAPRNAGVGDDVEDSDGAEEVGRSVESTTGTVRASRLCWITRPLKR